MCNFHDVSMPLMTSQILKSVDFTKTQKSRYLENEMRFSNKKINSLHIKSYFMPKNNFVLEVVFNNIRKKSLSWINTFVSNAPFLYRKGFWFFQGVEKGCIGSEWVKWWCLLKRGPYWNTGLIFIWMSMVQRFGNDLVSHQIPP